MAEVLQQPGPAGHAELSGLNFPQSSQSQAMVAALERLNQLSIATQPTEANSSSFDPWAFGLAQHLPSPWDLNAWQYRDAWLPPNTPHLGMMGTAMPVPRPGTAYQGYNMQSPVHPNQIPIGVAAATRSGPGGAIYPPGVYAGSSSPMANAGKRAGNEFSHNKAITKRLASAVHYQQILDIIAEFVHQFDEVNVATALHRLAKLQPPNLSNQPPSIIYTNQFQQLIYAIKTLLDRFEAQAVSNTMWAFATLGYYPDGDTLDNIGEHAVTIISTFRPQATSNTLWAYAKLGYPPPESLLAAAAHQMVIDFPKSVPQDISNTLWAYATLRHYPGSELLDGAAKQAVFTIQRFKPQEVANTLWSYATLGHDPNNLLLDAMAAQMAERIQHFRPQAISNSLWAYAKLGYNPGREVLDVTAQRAVQSLPQYTSQEIANTLWALATLEHHPGVQLLDASAVQIARRIEQFSPQDTTNSLWAYAKLFHYPCNDLLQSAAMYCLRHWHRFKPQEVANMFWALAILKACPPDTWRLLLDKLGNVPVASFDDADKHQMYQVYLLLDSAAAARPVGGRVAGPSLAASFPPALLESALAVWKASARQTGRISKLHEEVSQALWSLGMVHTNEHITPDGLFCVDIAMQDSKVVLEVDGPSHFSANSHRPLGRTVGRRCMLESRGYVVRSIPFYEWNSVEGVEQQKAYLSRLLASAYAFSRPVLA